MVVLFYVQRKIIVFLNFLENEQFLFGYQGRLKLIWGAYYAYLEEGGYFNNFILFKYNGQLTETKLAE